MKVKGLFEYTAVTTNGLIIHDTTAKAVYKEAEAWRREGIAQERGQYGYTLYHNGKPFYTCKRGLDVTLREAEVSVRLYNTMLRHAIRNGDIGHAERDMTIGKLRELFIQGRLHLVRNAGTPTYREMYRLLVKYTGLDAALAECIKAEGPQDWRTNYR